MSTRRPCPKRYQNIGYLRPSSLHLSCMYDQAVGDKGRKTIFLSSEVHLAELCPTVIHPLRLSTQCKEVTVRINKEMDSIPVSFVKHFQKCFRSFQRFTRF